MKEPRCLHIDALVIETGKCGTVVIPDWRRFRTIELEKPIWLVGKQCIPYRILDCEGIKVHRSREVDQPARYDG